MRPRAQARTTAFHNPALGFLYLSSVFKMRGHGVGGWREETLEARHDGFGGFPTLPPLAMWPGASQSAFPALQLLTLHLLLLIRYRWGSPWGLGGDVNSQLLTQEKGREKRPAHLWGRAVSWTVCPQIHLHPEPQSATWFGNQVFANVVKVKIKMRLYWTKVGPISNNWCPYKRLKRIHRTQRWGWCEDGGNAWSDTSTSQQVPRVASRHQKLGERHGADPHSRSCRNENQLCQYLDFRLLASWTVTRCISAVLSHLVCDSVSWQPQETHASGTVSIKTRGRFLSKGPVFSFSLKLSAYLGVGGVHTNPEFASLIPRKTPGFPWQSMVYLTNGNGTE